MDIAILSILFLLVIVCLIAIVPRGKSKTKPLGDKYMTDSKTNIYNATSEIFSEYYKKSVAIFRSSPVAQNVEFEILTPLHTVFNFATSELPKEKRSEIMDAVYESMLDSYYDLDSKVFSQRLNTYKDILLKKDIHNLWAFGKTVLPDNIISNSAAICGDILCNPECADDYYNAPILLHDAFILLDFAKDMQVFNDTLLLLFKHVMKRLVLPLK